MKLIKMEKLWAPWRMSYIKSERDKGCVFCDKIKSNNDRDSLILYRGSFNFVIMNLFPYNNGHIMIIPYLHTAKPQDLNEETKLEVLNLSDASMDIIKSKMNPDGFNFGANFGRSAGAGIAQHLHYHIVPRWDGDTNFMPVLNETKTIIEYLKETYDSLINEFAKIK